MRLESDRDMKHYAQFELRINEDTGRRYWWGAEDGWKDPTEIGEDGILTLDAQHFAVGTVLTLTEPSGARRREGVIEDEMLFESDRATPYCQHCGGDLEWEDCGACENGYAGHDCGEDCCACLEPDPNMLCEQCGGRGGWWTCKNTFCTLGETR